MKTNKLRLMLAAFLTLLATVSIYAYDIEMNGVYYNITDAYTQYVEVEVTSKSGGYSGAITIPRQFSKDGVTYTVTAIGDCAFQSCESLTSVTCPRRAKFSQQHRTKSVTHESAILISRQR